MMLSTLACQRSAIIAACTLLSGISISAPAYGVTVREDVWKTYGGSQDNLTAGFKPFMALATQPQFRSVVQLQYDADDRLTNCSGTWIGNNRDGNAIVLTAAHCFDREGADFTYFTGAGTILQQRQVWVKPEWYDARSSDQDLAVAELTGPIEDSGEPPVLYSDHAEEAYEGTIVGYGLLGTNVQGEKEDFNPDLLAAAAKNLIEEPYEGQLTVDFDDGSDPSAKPLELEGIPGSGDSGGALWIDSYSGWRLVGVVSSDINFARISYSLDFILAHFPDATVGGE